MNFKRWRQFLGACVVSGLVWQLPMNWLLFIPIAAFWLLIAGLLGSVLASVIHDWLSRE